MSKKKIRLTIRVQILALTLVSMIVLTGIIMIYSSNFYLKRNFSKRSLLAIKI